MSASLMWEPARRKAESLPYELMAVLREKFQGGQWGGQRTKFTHEHDKYICGLRDAGVRGAQELLDAIEAHVEIELWLEY